jgi:hypothetical protein
MASPPPVDLDVGRRGIVLDGRVATVSDSKLAQAGSGPTQFRRGVSRLLLISNQLEPGRLQHSRSSKALIGPARRRADRSKRASCHPRLLSFPA